MWSNKIDISADDFLWSTVLFWAFDGEADSSTLIINLFHEIKLKLVLFCSLVAGDGEGFCCCESKDMSKDGSCINMN